LIDSLLKARVAYVATIHEKEALTISGGGILRRHERSIDPEKGAFFFQGEEGLRGQVGVEGEDAL
jgi:hypothetical protein